MNYVPLIIFLILCGVQAMKNGHFADQRQFPFVVSIQHELSHLCSGTIIDKSHILTVAHVVLSYPDYRFLIVPGISRITWPYCLTVTVAKIHHHPDYKLLPALSFDKNDQYFENDIAILKLDEPLPLNGFIGVVSLTPTNFESYRCFECSMISWNRPNERLLEEVVLMWDIVDLLENSRCQQWGTHVLANQQCFIDLFETAEISTEDLGSPIICGGSMVGMIVKEARRHRADSPATFLSIANYANFISNIINDDEVKVASEEFPYAAAVWHNSKHVCGGIIVNINQVITAGHCIRGRRRIYLATAFKVAVGSNKVAQSDSSAQWYKVIYLKVHSHFGANYNGRDAVWVEHDIGLITVSRPFLWSPIVQKVRFTSAENLSLEQSCQVLHWKPKKIRPRKEYRILTKNSVELVDQQQLSVPLRQFQIAVKNLHSLQKPESGDIGNPVICGNEVLGIMVRTHSINEQSELSPIIFLRIRPYMSQGFFNVE